MARIIEPQSFKDNRGELVTYDHGLYAFRHSYYSVSKKGVLRGMHNQKNTAKLVYVLKGKILDVSINPKTGHMVSVELSDKNKKAVLIPGNWFHGFVALEDATVHYLQTRKYHPKDELGIRYDSFGFTWPKKLIISQRDENFVSYPDL